MKVEVGKFYIRYDPQRREHQLVKCVNYNNYISVYCFNFELNEEGYHNKYISKYTEKGKADNAGYDLIKEADKLQVLFYGW